MSRKIFIKSIPRESALGIHEWKNDTSTKSLDKTKVGRSNTRLMALYSSSQGGLANYISYTPWIDSQTGKQKVGLDGKGLMMQQMLEEKYSLAKDTLHNKPYRKSASLDTEKLSYYQTKSWILNDGSTVLDLTMMDDELFYYVCLASSMVANSEKEWRSHKWPKAQFYIALENESEEIKHKRNDGKVKAFAKMVAPEMVPTIKRKIISILEVASTKSDLTLEQVDNLLVDYIEKSTYTAGSNIDKFLILASMVSNPKGKEELEARFILKQAMDTKIIYEKQGSYTWVRSTGPILIADRYDEAIEYLLSPKRTKELEEIQLQIKEKL